MENPTIPWPLFDLRLTTRRLVLRPMTDDDIPAFIAAAQSGIHDPARSPFSYPWTSVPEAELPANMAVHVWRTRAQTTAAAWTLPFGVWHEGELVGMQDLVAVEFGTLRTVSTGSWLRQSAQGRGIGTEMRTAVVLYAFDHLGAEVAESEAAGWNAASLGVSRAVGYEPNGIHRKQWSAAAEDVQLLRLTPDRLHRPAWTLHVEGHDGVASFQGLGAAVHADS
ncbi:GNAT family N-acetyltransferase [Arthrobacter sp. JSM 101049]|uniref:GNAT family N-acetyltransferase n=1 Tax=Arthrobacter sp. JSM 101049 TaxID=929097 RepID=UPI00356285DB